MGNALTNPGRFVEKKIMHEQFGLPDPLQPHKNAHAAACASMCFDQDQKLNPPSTNYADKNRINKQFMNTGSYTYCVNRCITKN